MLEFLVEKFDPTKREATIHLWSPKQKMSERIFSTHWKEGREEEYNGITTLAMLGEHIFLGMNDGHIVEVGKDGTVVKRYGPRVTAIGYNSSDERIRVGPTKINDLVAYDGKVYDASLAGLYETVSGKIVDERQIGTIEIFRGRLCIIPIGAEAFAYQRLKQDMTPSVYVDNASYTEVYDMERQAREISSREAHAGALIDALTKEIIVDKVRSTHCQRCIDEGAHAVTDNKIYTKRRGDVYDYIEVKDTTTREVIDKITVEEQRGFVVHQARVYDIRRELRSKHWWSPSGKRKVVWSLYPSDEGTGRNEVYNFPDGWGNTGIVSGEETGMLIALYDKQRDRSKIVSHLNPKSALLEAEGYVTIRKIR